MISYASDVIFSTRELVSTVILYLLFKTFPGCEKDAEMWISSSNSQKCLA